MTNNKQKERKNMKKTLKVLGIIAVVLLVVLLLCPLWLGPVAAMVANKVVPGITGTDFSVEKISINPYAGTLRVEQLRLANPQGYDAEDAVKVGLLSVKIAPLTVLGKTVTVRDVTIEDPYVSYLDAKGTNNFDQILANVNAGKTPEEKGEEEKEKGEGKKVVVERLSVSGTRVRYGIITLPIPSIVLTGIGASQGGVTIESVGLEIWESIKKAFVSTGGAIGNAAKSLGEGAASLLNGITGGGDSKGSVGESAKKATEAVSDGAKKAADTVTDGAKKATEAIGNLFK